jgi:hypothetical protein
LSETQLLGTSAVDTRVPAIVVAAAAGGGRTTLVERILGAPAGERVAVARAGQRRSGVRSHGPGTNEKHRGSRSCPGEPAMGAPPHQSVGEEHLDPVMVQRASGRPCEAATDVTPDHRPVPQTRPQAPVAGIDASRLGGPSADRFSPSTARSRSSAGPVVINKADPVDPAASCQPPGLVRALNPTAPVVTAVRAVRERNGIGGSDVRSVMRLSSRSTVGRNLHPGHR